MHREHLVDRPMADRLIRLGQHLGEDAPVVVGNSIRKGPDINGRR